MKLKQRAIMTGSLFLVMTTLFLVGMLLSSRPEGAEESVGNKEERDKRRIKLPDIPGVRDYIVDQRINNPGNKDRQAVADALMARYNRSRGLPVVQRGQLQVGDHINKDKNPDSLRKDWEWDVKRRLQQNPRHDKPSDVLDKLPRGAELLNVLAQQRSDKVAKDQFVLPAQKEDPLNQFPEGIGKPSPESNGVIKAGAENESPLREGERDPWQVWHSWVKQDQFYPEDVFWSKEMNSILHAMATYPITLFDVGHKGTQLKASMLLDKQRTAFKPKRYERNEVIQGDPYAGFDRHNAEIAGFHLDGLLGFRISPPVVGRRVNLTALWPVTSKTLRDTYFKDDSGNTCFYGKCYYCRREEGACASGEVMEGSVTLWLPGWYEMKTRRHPYQRTYRPNRKAKWEADDSYCRTVVMKPGSDYYHGLLEFTDSCILDFLMGNADRHHYETYSKAKRHGKLLHIDNGKSFGNPDHDEMSILAPLVQCCRVRESTWQRLQELLQSDISLSQQLDHSLKRDPIYPILTAEHLHAIDRRLAIIDKTVRQCIAMHDRSTVVVSKWPPE